MACSDILIVSGMKFEAQLARQLSTRIAYGLDPARLEAEIETAVKSGIKAVLSFGTAAGLSPALKPGAIIVVKTIYTENESFFNTDVKFAGQLYAKLPGAVMADVIGVDKAVKSVEEKFQLWQKTGVVAADMESQRVARLAGKYNLPFAVLRVVLDDASCALPAAALVATNVDGTINFRRLFISLATNPKQIGAMRQLGKYHAAAKKSLCRSVALIAGGFDGVHLLG